MCSECKIYAKPFKALVVDPSEIEVAASDRADAQRLWLDEPIVPDGSDGDDCVDFFNAGMLNMISSFLKKFSWHCFPLFLYIIWCYFAENELRTQIKAEAVEVRKRARLLRRSSSGLQSDASLWAQEIIFYFPVLFNFLLCWTSFLNCFSRTFPLCFV